MLEDDLQLSDSEDSDTEQVSVEFNALNARDRSCCCPNLCFSSFWELRTLPVNVQATEKPPSPPAPPGTVCTLLPQTIAFPRKLQENIVLLSALWLLERHSVWSQLRSAIFVILKLDSAGGRLLTPFKRKSVVLDAFELWGWRSDLVE